MLTQPVAFNPTHDALQSLAWVDSRVRPLPAGITANLSRPDIQPLRLQLPGLTIALSVPEPTVPMLSATFVRKREAGSVDGPKNPTMIRIVHNIILDQHLMVAVRTLGNDAPAGGPWSIDLTMTTDPEIGRLVEALFATQDMVAAAARTYETSIATAIITRLGSQGLPKAVKRSGRTPGALAKWRLRRVAEYIDRRIGEPIRLADLAQAAGLTRMYFAAQFREAVGICPHEYLLRRRIVRAQQLLSVSSTTLSDVALGVGFQTQAHFTTVFKRFVGETPHRWRCAQYQDNEGLEALRVLSVTERCPGPPPYGPNRPGSEPAFSASPVRGAF